MDDAVVNNASLNLDKYLGHDPVERTLVLQLGGSDPDKLAEAAARAELYGGFSEINLNCGCPSNNAKAKAFGACLMMTPDRVREIVSKMKRRTHGIPITVKSRLSAIDTRKKAIISQSPPVSTLVANIKQAGCSKVIVHARDCFLRGLSPAQNRTVPPLRYDDVFSLCESFPDMHFTLNGGVQGIEHAKELMAGSHGLGGVMIGRAAYKNPWLLGAADHECMGMDYISSPISPQEVTKTRMDVVQRYLSYADKILDSENIISTACGDGGVSDGVDDGSEECVFSDLCIKGPNTLPKLCKPLHHVLHGCGTASAFKQALDVTIKRAAKASHAGGVVSGEFVHTAMHDDGGAGKAHTAGAITKVFTLALEASGETGLQYLQEPIYVPKC